MDAALMARMFGGLLPSQRSEELRRDRGPGGTSNPGITRTLLQPRRTLMGGTASKGITWADPSVGVTPEALWYTLVDFTADQNYELDSWHVEQGATDSTGQLGALGPWGDNMGRGAAFVIAVNPTLLQGAPALGTNWYAGHGNIPGLSTSKTERAQTNVQNDVIFAVNFPPGDLQTATGEPGPVRVIPRTLGRGFVPIRRGDRLVAAFVIAGDSYSGISGDVFAFCNCNLYLGAVENIDAFAGAAPA